MIRHNPGIYPLFRTDQPWEALDLCPDYPNLDIPRDFVFRYDSFG